MQVFVSIHTVNSKVTLGRQLCNFQVEVLLYKQSKSPELNLHIQLILSNPKQSSCKKKCLALKKVIVKKGSSAKLKIIV